MISSLGDDTFSKQIGADGALVSHVQTSIVSSPPAASSDSILSDSSEPALETDPVCSLTNLANQAFAFFDADPGILNNDSANIICCADLNGTILDGCENDDPQTNVVVQVNVPAISIACEPQTNPIGPNEDTFINITTTGIAPGDDVCVDIILQTFPASEVVTPPDIPDAVLDPACAIVDALGNADVQFRGGDVAFLDIATVRCWVDTMENGVLEEDVFNPGEISVTEQTGSVSSAGSLESLRKESGEVLVKNSKHTSVPTPALVSVAVRSEVSPGPTAAGFTAHPTCTGAGPALGSKVITSISLISPAVNTSSS